jgi:hypothetical protein
VPADYGDYGEYPSKYPLSIFHVETQLIVTQATANMANMALTPTILLHHLHHLPQLLTHRTPLTAPIGALHWPGAQVMESTLVSHPLKSSL